MEPDLLDALADALIRKETLDEVEAYAVAGLEPPHEPEPAEPDPASQEAAAALAAGR
jgi:hypothetical protein